MTDNDHKRHKFIRQLNAGIPTWQADRMDDLPEESPLFIQGKPVDKFVQKNDGARVQPLPKDFAPKPEFLEYLQEYEGIPPEFTLSQVPEFKLYWMERGEARPVWQNVFKNHVIYRWKQKQSEKSQRSERSTVEQLTDTSWQNDDWFEQFED
ncbi:DnaT-like ssDNA-binding domain-containing protein [Candidatus Sororendozoicomonas aggregata]|uniref:DnaT-like ssDNA-binding domain-containing protein n=1 Tax=Candidatus Sororendozoicomonas aggregata TaxID=3073239 RepID=UPI002ED6B41C